METGKPRVYIAAPWVCKEQAFAAQQQFEEAGYTVMSHWITMHEDTDVPVNLKDQACEDLADLVLSDVFVILNLAKSEGKAFEFGVAAALEYPTIVVSSVEDLSRNVFYHLPTVERVDTVAQAIVRGWEIYNANKLVRDN